LQSLLTRANIPFIENAHLVRGLDYYNYCVYEWTTESLGAQGAVCGGGRYDGLVEMLGGKPTLAAGFAIGVERLVLMLDSLGKIPKEAHNPADVYVLVVGVNLAEQALELVQRTPYILEVLLLAGHVDCLADFHRTWPILSIVLGLEPQVPMPIYGVFVCPIRENSSATSVAPFFHCRNRAPRVPEMPPAIP